MKRLLYALFLFCAINITADEAVIISVLSNTQSNLVLLLTVDKPIIVRYVTVTNIIKLDDSYKTPEMKRLEMEISVKEQIFEKQFGGLPNSYANFNDNDIDNPLDILIKKWQERDVARSNICILNKQLRVLQIQAKEKELQVLKSMNTGLLTK